MPKLLFTDEQKTNLAKEAGITWVPDTNTFDKEYDPASGDYKMYMKLGNGSKFFGAKPITAKPDNALDAQVDYVKREFWGKTMQDIYGAMISTAPKDKGAIRDQIWAGPGGIYSNIDGITQQIQNLDKVLASDQSKIFNAIDPTTGKPVDPRIAVATFKQNQAAVVQQQNNLIQLQDMYRANLEQLTESEYQRQVAENKKNETALSYLKSIDDKKTVEEKMAEEKRQFEEKLAEEKRQYNTTNGITEPAKPGDFLKNQEGYRDKAYWDVNGWAIGYGQHAINWVPVKEGDTIDQKTADQDLSNRITNAKFASLVSVPLNENQKAALYSLEHNVGPWVWWFPSGKKIIDQINTWDIKWAAETLANSGIGTTEAKNHTVLPWLVKRRKEEAAMLLKEDNSNTTTTKKPATFNEFIEKFKIPDITLDEKWIDEMFQAVLKDYPTEKLETVAQAIRNRAPERLKKQIDDYSKKLGDKAVQDKDVEDVVAKIDTLTKESTASRLRILNEKYGDPEKVIETLHKAWFFDTYKASFWWDDDQYDAVQEFAKKNDIDLEKTLKKLNWD